MDLKIFLKLQVRYNYVMFDKLKIAIVYDWIDKWGGVERVLLELHEMFPRAEFFTSYYDKDKARWAEGIKINTSFIQKLPDFIRKNRVFSLPFYPFAFESFDFSDYDLVISVTSSFAKSIITKPDTVHICYLLTPTRFLWISPDSYFKSSLFNLYVSYLKKWDLVAAQRSDYIVSIAKTVAERCKKYYKRESEVIYPPFDLDYWNNIKSKIKNHRSKPQFKSQKYFLVVSRLEPYKKVDYVIKTFNKRKDSLIVVGTGTQENYLKGSAKKNIIFMKNITDEELAVLYRNAKALIMPQEEDFGYVALEAQFFGCPIVSYQKGGATETIELEKTGLFFANQSERSLRGALARFEKIEYNIKAQYKRIGHLNVEMFDKKVFRNSFYDFINSNFKVQISNL